MCFNNNFTETLTKNNILLLLFIVLLIKKYNIYCNQRQSVRMEIFCCEPKVKEEWGVEQIILSDWIGDLMFDWLFWELGSEVVLEVIRLSVWNHLGWRPDLDFHKSPNFIRFELIDPSLTPRKPPRWFQKQWQTKSHVFLITSISPFSI
jgi:hypothetical protein